MGRSFYPLAGHAVERFGVTIHIASQDLYYTMYEDDGHYFMKQFQRDAAGREINAGTREMVYVLGSGNHSRSYVAVETDRLYQMPVCWYPDPQGWDLCPGYELRNEYFARAVDDTCLFCHNGRVAWAGDFSNRVSEPPPHGISCERCHGPGSLHVEKWSAADAPAPPPEPMPSGAAADPTILNPARLPPEAAIQVCMQCHLGDSGQTDRVLRRRDHMAAYRPGMRLQDFLSVHVYEEALPGRFALGAQADRLALSRCATASGGRLLCTTCHDPHQEVYEVAAAQPDHFDRACAGCHAPESCPRPESRGGAGCVGCHMARAEPDDQKHTQFTDHWIRAIPAPEPMPRGAALRWRRSSADTPRHETPAQSALYRGRAYLNKKFGSPEGAQIPLGSLHAVTGGGGAAGSHPGRRLVLPGQGADGAGRCSAGGIAIPGSAAARPRQHRRDAGAGVGAAGSAQDSGGAGDAGAGALPRRAARRQGHGAD